VSDKAKGPFITILEIAFILALAMFLLRLAICWLSQIWWVLLILAVLIAAGVIAYRWWKSRHGEY
jgi:hypothetical protein